MRQPEYSIYLNCWNLNLFKIFLEFCQSLPLFSASNFHENQDYFDQGECILLTLL